MSIAEPLGPLKGHSAGTVSMTKLVSSAYLFLSNVHSCQSTSMRVNAYMMGDRVDVLIKSCCRRLRDCKPETRTTLWVTLGGTPFRCAQAIETSDFHNDFVVDALFLGVEMRVIVFAVAIAWVDGRRSGRFSNDDHGKD
jgi:hypothetical protein